MTISNQTANITIEGDGSTTAFAYNFLIPYQADGSTPAVQVIFIDIGGDYTTLNLGSDFTITGIADPSGGVVTYNPGSPIPVNTFLYIGRNLSYVQASAFPVNGFYPPEVESSEDTIVMQVQQLAALVGSAIKLTPGETATAFDSPAGRANTLVGFDGSGNLVLIPQ